MGSVLRPRCDRTWWGYSRPAPTCLLGPGQLTPGRAWAAGPSAGHWRAPSCSWEAEQSSDCSILKQLRARGWPSSFPGPPAARRPAAAHGQTPAEEAHHLAERRRTPGSCSLHKEVWRKAVVSGGRPRAQPLGLFSAQDSALRTQRLLCLLYHRVTEKGQAWQPAWGQTSGSPGD